MSSLSRSVTIFSTRSEGGVPQSLLRGRFLRRAGSCRPLFRCRTELLRLDECRIAFLSDIAAVL